MSGATSAPAPTSTVLAALIGTWSGEGRGDYATIEAFTYRETLEVTGDPSRLLVWEQRTTSSDGSRAMHRETGYLRILPDGGLEALVAQPTGVAEVHVGEVTSTGMHLRTVTVALTPSAKAVTEVIRRWTLVPADAPGASDRLLIGLDMAAMGHETAVHLRADLHRMAPPPDRR